MLIEEGYEVPDIIQDQMGLSDAHNVSRSAVVANLLSRSVCSMLSGICLLVSHVFFWKKTLQLCGCFELCKTWCKTCVCCVLLCEILSKPSL